MGLVGLFAYLFRERRRQGVMLDAHAPTLERDLLFFLVFFALAGLLGWGPPAALRIPLGIVFVAAYVFYVRRTLRGGGEVQGEETLDAAALRPPRRAPRATRRRGSACVQLLVGLGAMVGGAHLFVEELLGIADSLGVDALVLALILAPLATELPEKVNSFFWVREGKDALALGNISGAMVFQSTIPVGIGLLFTDWYLEPATPSLSIVLGVAGGLLAYLSLHRGALHAGRRLRAWFGALRSLLVAVGYHERLTLVRGELGQRLEHERRRAFSAALSGRPGRSCPSGR